MKPRWMLVLDFVIGVVVSTAMVVAGVILLHHVLHWCHWAVHQVEGGIAGVFK